MDNLMVEVFKHFQMKVVPRILLLQTQENPIMVLVSVHSPVQTLDELGEELVKSCDRLDAHVYQVSRNTLLHWHTILYAVIMQAWTFLRTDAYYKTECSITEIRISSQHQAFHSPVCVFPLIR